MENLKKYESIIMLKENLDNEEIKKQIEALKGVYLNSECQIEKIKDIGLKNLTYEVKGNKKGYCVVFYFWDDIQDVIKIEKYYKLNDNIIKYMIIKLD